MGPLVRSHLSWVAAIAVAVFDQITKAMIARGIPPGGSISIIPGFFDLTMVTNRGGIFGVLRDADGPIRGLLFNVVPVAVIAFMAWYGWSLPAERGWARAALGLILGGATGNLIDRVRLGHVVDFLHLHAGRFSWPDFNVADSAICVGVSILLVEGLFVRPERSAAPPASPPEAGP